MPPQSDPRAYVSLAPGIVLRLLESPALYNTRTDDLYELSEEAFSIMERCDGTRTLASVDMPDDLLSYAMEEGLLRLSPRPERIPAHVGENEVPSLRYLMVEITDRCNLRCRHCYLGDASEQDMPVGEFTSLARAFGDIGGLRMIVTGGEPLMHPAFAAINASLSGAPFRRILATNGTLLDEDTAARLNFHEVQVSLDGLEESHDRLRGSGAFKKALAGIDALQHTGIDVSVATMIQSGNLGELHGLRSLVEELKAVAWALDVPVPAGRLRSNKDLLPELSAAAPYLDLSFGEGIHEQGGARGCGMHLAGVDVRGSLMKCGFYRETASGLALPSLRGSWANVPQTGIPPVCTGCEFVKDCAGGCRFRAESLSGPGARDIVRCLQYGREINSIVGPDPG